MTLDTPLTEDEPHSPHQGEIFSRLPYFPVMEYQHSVVDTPPEADKHYIGLLTF